MSNRFLATVYLLFFISKQCIIKVSVRVITGNTYHHLDNSGYHKKTHPIIVYYQATYMTFTMGETEDDESDGGHDDDDDDCDGDNIMLLIA